MTILIERKNVISSKYTVSVEISIKNKWPGKVIDGYNNALIDYNNKISGLIKTSDSKLFKSLNSFGNLTKVFKYLDVFVKAIGLYKVFQEEGFGREFAEEATDVAGAAIGAYAGSELGSNTREIVEGAAKKLWHGIFG